MKKEQYSYTIKYVDIHAFVKKCCRRGSFSTKCKIVVCDFNILYEHNSQISMLNGWFFFNVNKTILFALITETFWQKFTSFF